MATVYIGKVVDISDIQDGERIKVQILPADKYKKLSNLPYAFPLLPKMIHIKPKVGEAVFVVCENDDHPNSQRYYLGPIISQPQFMYNESDLSATALLKGGVKVESESPNNYGKTKGAMPENDDIAFLGRKNCDIILSDNDLRIRCGAHLVNEANYSDFGFNKQAPAYIKLKYYPEPLKQQEDYIQDLKHNSIIDMFPLAENKHNTTQSTATIVADKINLISPNGDPYIDIANEKEGISDEEMKKIIDKCHQLPYGDILVDFLQTFIRMFKSHTHKYDNMEPCPDTASGIFDAKWGSGGENLNDKILSKDIRIN